MARQLERDAPCGCGHAHLAHEHYRRGTDCALCECEQFRLAPAPARKGLRRPGRALA